MKTAPIQPETQSSAHGSPGQVMPPGKQAHPRSRATHAWRHSLPLVGMIVLTVLAGTMLLGPFHHAFAHGLSFSTCRNATSQEKAAFCNGADPIGGSCAFDAVTALERPMLLGSRQVGLAQVRYSPSCGTYWGRGFSFVRGASLTVYLPILGTGDAASFLTQSPSIYSNMFYDPTKGEFPTVIVGLILSPSAVAQVTIQGIG